MAKRMITVALTEVTCHVETEILGFVSWCLAEITARPLKRTEYNSLAVLHFQHVSWVAPRNRNNSQGFFQGGRKHIFLQACHFLPYWMFLFFFFFPECFYCLLSAECLPKPQCAWFCSGTPADLTACFKAWPSPACASWECCSPLWVCMYMKRAAQIMCSGT